MIFVYLVTALEGNVGIGHVRYPTAGGSCSSEAQPLYTNAPYGLALAHNGNLTNPDELRDIMRQTHRHINTNSDSELLLNVFAEELQRKRLALKLAPDEIFATVRALMKRCKGQQSLYILHDIVFCVSHLSGGNDWSYMDLQAPMVVLC